MLKRGAAFFLEQRMAPAAFRRLCVETGRKGGGRKGGGTSRLQAAVC